MQWTSESIASRDLVRRDLPYAYRPVFSRSTRPSRLTGFSAVQVRPPMMVCSLGCPNELWDVIFLAVIVDALLRGVSEGQDILTMSLGGADGWTESSSSVISSRIAASGKIVTIAAGESDFSPYEVQFCIWSLPGNDGANGAFYTSSPGNGLNAISVASIDNTAVTIQNATVHGVTHAPIPYFNTFPLPVTDTLPIFAVSTDTTVEDDACDPLPDSTPDLSKFVVIVRRGTCTFVSHIRSRRGLS